MPDCQWRGIESAPKDGTKIDLWVVFPKGAHRYADGYWDDGEWRLSVPESWYDPRPQITHWMPLPLPPLPEGGLK
jgi:hypothetical protein